MRSLLIQSVFSKEQQPTPGAGRQSYLAVCGGVDPVVVHTPLVPERDGQLPGAALAFSHQEAAVDQAAEQILRGTA